MATKIRGIRIDDETWALWGTESRARGHKNVTELIKDLMAAGLAKPPSAKVPVRAPVVEQSLAKKDVTPDPRVKGKKAT